MRRLAAFLRSLAGILASLDVFRAVTNAVSRPLNDNDNNMKRTYLTLAFSSLLFSSSCSTQEVKTPTVTGTNSANVAQNSMEPRAASTQPKDGNYPGRGKVTKINMDLGSVELDHEEIVGVMPPMIMEFYVKDKALLNGLTLSDKVEFVLEYKHPSETIIGIKKAQ